MAISVPGHLPRISILGIPVDNITEDEAMAQIRGWIAARTPRQICTVNPEFVMAAQHNRVFWRVLQAAALNTPDGFGLLLVARLRRTPFRARVTGVALVERIAREAAHQGWSLFLLGAAPGVADAAATTLRARYAGLHVAGCYAGSPRAENEAQIRELIQAARPDLLLVAYGHPAQDLWIARNQALLGVPVAIGVGGTFDEITGRVPLAPAWLHRLGLKWLYRLVTQPWRWRRIVTAVPVFLWAALREQLSM